MLNQQKNQVAVLLPPCLIPETLSCDRLILMAHQPPGTVLWQSFDYPHNILLPGMKLGMNHKTGHLLHG
jgi:hypothetical protein